MSKRRPGSKHFDALDKHRWARVRREVFDRDGWRCTKCGGAGSLECHHVTELRHGGDPYDKANLQTFCRNCHVRHHNPPDPARDAWRALVAEIASVVAATHPSGAQNGLCALSEWEPISKLGTNPCYNKRPNSPMDAKMTESQKIEMRRSAIRERLAAIAKLSGDEYGDAIKTEESGLQDEYGAAELRYRSAVIAEDKALEGAKGDAGEPDAEKRERIELRSKASLGTYIKSAILGRHVQGAEAELQVAAGVDGIPLELWDVPAPEHRAGAEHRAVTPAPGTVGINLDPIRPAVFAPSIADKLMIEMPKVASGTYATGTIATAGITADAVAKGADVPQTAGAITVGTTAPHRIGASLGLTLEDIASIGVGNFESILRQHISMVLSDHLDDQMINGDIATEANELEGIFKRLTNPSNPAANVETWTRFLAIQSGGIDGLWATELEHIAIVCGVDTYRLAAATFQGSDSEESAASYLKRMGAQFATNKRMPATDANVQQGILCRKGRPGMRLAVCPTWGSVSVDDIYSGARKGERYFTVSTLVGDVILVQPDAYAQVAFRVST